MEKTEVNLKGLKIKIKPEVSELGGQEITIEDWWDKLTGKSWMFSDNNPACIHYALRTGLQTFKTPVDNNVLYGHLENHLGKLVHLTELEGY